LTQAFQETEMPIRMSAIFAHALAIEHLTKISRSSLFSIASPKSRGAD